jgi:hypothetical protein
MKEMGWSWSDLEATPMYVRRFCADLMGIRRKCEADHMRRSQR